MPPDRFGLFLRISLFDLIVLPTSQKLHEHNVLANLSKIFTQLWSTSYKAMDPKVVVTPHEIPHNADRLLSARHNIPIWMTLRDWLSIGTQAGDWTSSSGDSASHRLPLSSAARRAYWVRFVTVLECLQNAGYIRDALKMANTKEALVNVMIEFRYFAVLLYLQTIRTQPNVWTKPALSVQNEAASLTGRRPRSASDGALEHAWPVFVPDMRSPTTSRLSPRHRDGSLTNRMRASQPVGRLTKEEIPSVIETLMRYLPIMLALTGCHFDTVAKLLQTDGRQPSVIEATLKRIYLTPAHTKYMAVLFQGYERSSGGYRSPILSQELETRLNAALWSAERPFSAHKGALMVSVTEFINLLRERLDMQIAMSDVITSFTLAPSGTRSSSYRNNRLESPTKGHPLLSPRNSGKNVNEPEIVTPREPVLKAEPTRSDLQIISSRRKDVIYVPQTPTPGQKTLDDLSIIDCQDCWILATTKFLNVKIGNCRNVRCILPCVAGNVVVHFGRQVTVHSACYGALVSNSYDTKLFLLSRSPPVIVGDTRDTVLGPYNVAYDKQKAWLDQHGIRFDAETLRMWSLPVVCPLGTANRTNTPRDESRKSEGRNQDDACALDGGLMPGCARPSELEVLLYPSDGGIPVYSDPGNLALPEAHAQAVAQGVLKRQKALAAYLARVEKCRETAQKQAFVQECQSRFIEWLQSNKRMHELLARGDLGGLEVSEKQRFHR